MSKVKTTAVESTKVRGEKRVSHSEKFTAAKPYSGRETYILMKGQGHTNEKEPVAVANVIDVQKMVAEAERIQEYIAKGGSKSESKPVKTIELSGLFGKSIG